MPRLSRRERDQLVPPDLYTDKGRRSDKRENPYPPQPELERASRKSSGKGKAKGR